MPEIRYRSSVRLSNNQSPPQGTALNPPMSGFNGVRFYSGSREIIRDEKRLALVLKRRELESRVMTVDQVADRILQALRDQRGFSIIRLGDAEILTLAQDTVFPTSANVPIWGDLMAELCRDPLLGKGDNNEVVRWRDMMHASGVNYPDLQVRDQLAQAVKSASLIGIPVSNRPGRSRAHLKLVEGFQTVLLEELKLLNLAPEKMRFGDSALHYLLYTSGWMNRILSPGDYPQIAQRYSFSPGYKPGVLLVGNRAGELADLMGPKGLRISGVVKPVNLGNIDESLAAISRHSFDIALMAAGIAAKILCSATAERMSRVAIDAGHLFDLLVDHHRHLDHQRTRIPYEWML
ncbi:GT-D fold domain-containing protein [Syntrophomonas curvata]